MRADVFTTTGESHLSCQDYSRIGPDSIVLSDGCSSSPDTDIGARLEALSALQAERDAAGLTSSVPDIAGLASKMACNLDLKDKSVLDATMIMIQYKRPWAYITMVGDGVCGWKNRDGRIYLFKRTYDGNAPMYVGYLLSNLKDKVKGKESLEYLYTYAVPPELGGNYPLFMSPTFKEPFPAINHDEDDGTIRVKLPEDKVELVFGATDGMLSFYRNVSTETSKVAEVAMWDVVASRFLSFKTFAGKFVSRRAKRALQEMKEEGYVPMDDFSMGVVLMEKEEPKP